jgi:hypothetical protein
MQHDSMTEVLIEQAAIDAYCLIVANGSEVNACMLTIKAGKDVFKLRLSVNESEESIHQQADAWSLLFSKLVSLGMTRDFGETGIERVMNFLDSLTRD